MSDIINETVWVSATSVRRRYDNISATTLWRWEVDSELGFPKPMQVGSRKYYRLSDLEAWEAARAASRSLAAA
jgi:predicted DNA-binding transcriptional regulator AlpA